MSIIIRRTIALLIIVLSPVFLRAEEKPKPKPEFRAARPYWIPVDKTTTIRVLGQDLAPKAIEFLDNRIGAKILKTEAPKDDAEKAKGNTALDVEVIAPAALPPGSYKFKLIHEVEATDKQAAEKKDEKKEITHPEGRIYIDDIANEIEEKEPNNSLLAPQVITAPLAIKGKIDNEGADVFRIDGKVGETWQFDILARRAGATWEPVMRLRDPRRALVAAVVDQGNDCTLKYQLPTDGPYLLEIFDGDNRSNGEYFYRLSVRYIPTSKGSQ